MDLERLMRLARGRKSTVLGLAAATALLVFLMGLLLVDYQAQASLLVKPLGLQPPAGDATHPPITTEATLPALGMVYAPQLAVLSSHGNSFISILKSRTIVGQVVTRLRLDQAGGRSGGLVAGLLEMLKQPVRFVAYGRLPAVEPSPVAAGIERTRRSINAKLATNASVIEITVEDGAAQRAADIANTLLDVFVEYSRTENARSARASAEFVDRQLTTSRADLTKARDALADLQRQYGIDRFSDFTKEGDRIARKLETMEEQLENNKYRRELLQDSRARTERELEANPEYRVFSVTTDSNSRLMALKNRVSDLRIQLQGMLFDYAPTSPQVKSLENQIAATEQAMASEVERLLTTQVSQANPIHMNLLNQKLATDTELAAMPVMDDQTRTRIREYRTRLNALETASERLSQLVVTIASLQSKESELQANLHTARLLEAKAPSEVEILERAVVPRYPGIRGAPLSLYVMLGFLAGLIGGVGFVALQDRARGQVVWTASDSDRDSSPPEV